MFAASKKKERMREKIERLRERERRVLSDRREIQRKQMIIKTIQKVQKSFKIDVNKLIVMPIDDLLKKKHLALNQANQIEAAKRLQRWWRDRTGRKQRLFAPFGIWEIKKMFDKIVIIQKWFRKVMH